MAFAATLIALVTGPLADLTGSAAAAIQISAGLGLAFTVGHIVALIVRIRNDGIEQPRAGLTVAGILDITIIVVGAIALGSGGVVAYEWLLIFLLARPDAGLRDVLADVAASP